MVREIGRVNSVNAFLNSNLALPMVREIGRVNSVKRFPELKSRASYGPR
ncbi:hypothetical protein ACO1KF_14240 [Leptospira interrogans serovar Hardjo-prajitno]|nr:hypothetical protein [Leptospira interrogans]UQX06370.1 hypothetical protein MY415_14040 [Leptospira interrogans]